MPQFCSTGYALANIGVIAQSAGISTKTLYRLYQTKADLFAEVVSSRIDQFMSAFDASTPSSVDLAMSLQRILSAYATMTLSDEAVLITKLVVAEATRFPEIATSFYEKAITRTNTRLADWLAVQRDNGLIDIGDALDTAGMLRGMMIMEPQRAIVLNQAKPLLPEQIEDRAAVVARMFLRGCQAAPAAEESLLVWF